MLMKKAEILSHNPIPCLAAIGPQQCLLIQLTVGLNKAVNFHRHLSFASTAVAKELQKIV